MNLPIKVDLKRRRVRIIVIILLIITGYLLALPAVLFTQPYAHVLLDRKSQLLQAKIASDGQWRFPSSDSIPEKFQKAIIAFEDKRFRYHPGVDPVALLRACWYNIKAGEIVSGGSTITMQLIRLSRSKPRTFWQKVIEMLLALRIELTFSKREILTLYADHAPFGGNVVGINAAAWRYFGRPAHQLSWAEAACLAVLPNNPSMVRLDKNRKELLEKRNRLLRELHMQGVIDGSTSQLAMLEPVPVKPLPLPERAPHLLYSIANRTISANEKNEAYIHTTLSGALQDCVTDIVNRHQVNLSSNGVHNSAALVLEVETGNVLAYVGNVYRPSKPEYESYVDIIQAPRSPGSTLKPLLYAGMLQDGLILPHSLVADIPTQIAGYSPQNFDHGYDGAVPADIALARSLNVPAVRMLQQYRVERFYNLLQRAGVTTLKLPSSHYGLSLILGGGENTMWELGGIYANMARTLNHYSGLSGKYRDSDWHMPIVGSENRTSNFETSLAATVFNAGAIYQTFNAMNELVRPGDEYVWNQFESSQKIAWKTGTSYGFRDAWSVGITPGYVVVVWAGNADGEGRAGLTGISAAAPIMFDIFKHLPASGWFDTPFDDLHSTILCKKSGFLATSNCEVTDSQLVTAKGLRFTPCPYHQLIHLDHEGKFRVSESCESPSLMKHVNWFILPPVMEWYYKNHDHAYRTVPLWKKGCRDIAIQSNVMEMIYPKRSNTIYVPIDLDGLAGKCIFEVAHRIKETTIYWHLDDQFIGTTKSIHQMAMNPDRGKHVLVLVDENGERIEQHFDVIKKNGVNY